MNRTRIIAGVLVCILLLWFLFRGTDWGELALALWQIDLAWLILSITFAFASLFARVQRWSYVVRATLPARFWSLFSATQIGMLVNSIAPARLGDLARTYVLARMERIPLARSLTLVALDRINDVFALVVVLSIALLAFPMDRDIGFAAGAFGNTEPFTVSSTMIGPAARGLAAGLVVLVAVLVLLYIGRNVVTGVIRRFIQPQFPRSADWSLSLFNSFTEGMRVLHSGTSVAKSLVFSLVTWGLVALSLWALLVAFGLDAPWYAPFLMLAILGVFTLVTVTPGLVGQYHVAIVAALLMILPEMDTDRAKAFSIVAHLVAVAPPVILGTYSLLRENFRFGQLLAHEKVPLK